MIKDPRLCFTTTQMNSKRPLTATMTQNKENIRLIDDKQARIRPFTDRKRTILRPSKASKAIITGLSPEASLVSVVEITDQKTRDTSLEDILKVEMITHDD